MISPLVAKLDCILLEKRISFRLENYEKRAKEHAGFQSFHLTLDDLITLRIIAKGC
jgi:hypothetical protein